MNGAAGGMADNHHGLVLVVDDDAAIRSVVRTVLEADGYRVVEAVDGPMALRMLEQVEELSPDLVVLDVMMPGIDGIEVCRQIDHERVRVIMLSARDDRSVSDAAAAAGADAYITKPFSAIDLLDVLEAMVAR